MILMKYSRGIYIGLAVVFFASFAAAYLLPIGQLLKTIMATPAAVALVAAVYQILKDQAEFERITFLQRQQQIFNLGATSHMANLAFDKHAEFCEKYMSEVHQIVTDLRVRSSNADAINEHFMNLRELTETICCLATRERGYAVGSI